MANVIGELIWKITGDNSGIDSALKKSENQAKKTGTTFGKVAKLAAGAFAAIGIARIAKQLVNLSSDAEETAQKFGVVFSSISDDANAAAKNLAENFGLAQTESKKLLSDTGDLLTGFGFTQESALSLSTELNELAVDLASFTNYAGGAEGASSALTKALLGEREQIKSLGIAISEADLKAFIESQGTSYKLATRQQKAQATLALAIQQSANAMGDFERSSDSYANVQRRVNARFTDMQEEIGQELLPALSALGLAFLEATKDGAPLLEFFKDMIGFISKAILGYAKLTAIINQNDIAGKQEEANQKGREALNIAKVAQQQIEKRYGSMQRAVELAKTDNERGREANAFLQVRNNALEKTQKYLDKASDLMERGSENLDVMAGIEDKINGVTKSTNDRLKERGPIIVKTNKKVDETKDKLTKAQEEAKKLNDYLNSTGINTETWATALGDVYNKWGAITTAQKQLQSVNAVVQAGGSEIISILSSIIQLQQAQTTARVDELDRQMNAELEAAGVADETTVEQAQTEYDIAQESGTALEKEEKRVALVKAQIEEKYQKQKAQAQYDGDLQAWEMQKKLAVAQSALAIINAYSSAAAVPLIGYILAPIAAGAAAVASAIQYQAIVASKPTAPAFAEGGIVPGTSYTGDKVSANVNSKEAILTQAQQKRFMDIANGAGGGGGGGIINVYLGNELIYSDAYKASQRGDLLIDKRAVVSR